MLGNYIPLVVCHHNIVSLFAAFVAASENTYKLLLLSSWLHTTTICILPFVISVQTQFNLQGNCRTFGECNHQSSKLTLVILPNTASSFPSSSFHRHTVGCSIAEHLESTFASTDNYIIAMFPGFHALLCTS